MATGRGWFPSFRCFTRDVKVAFHNGAVLDPPPESSKDPATRYLHIHHNHEDGDLDEHRFRDWVRQAAALPGWDGF
jgi:hypothetical protein